jgi:hypothetical protein
LFYKIALSVLGVGISLCMYEMKTVVVVVRRD